MKKTTYLALILILFVSVQCVKQQDYPTDETVLPKGAIPFEYDEKMLKCILFDAVMNDSIPMKVSYDTGNGGLIVISDSLKNQVGNEVMFKKANVVHTKGVCFLESNHPYFELFGSNFAIVGMDFFKDRIIKISYRDKYIQEITDMKELEEYAKIKPELRIGMFEIPIKIYVQGKCIDEYVRLDTGNNGYVFFGSSIRQKHNIENKDAYQGGSHTQQGIHSGFSIPADSFLIAGFPLSDIPVAFSKEDHIPIGGLLGNSILQNFTIVLDLKNNYFYIKPND